MCYPILASVPEHARYADCRYTYLCCAAKLVTVVAGIKKLSIMMTVVDDLVSVDNLIEDYLISEPNNEYIQSCDILAFNKICKFSLPYTLICILTYRIDLDFRGANILF